MSLSTFLDGRPYTQLRGLTWLSLSDSGLILRGSITGDSGGGGTMTWGTAGTVACRIDPLGGGEQEAAERISDRSSHVITLPPGTDVTTTDRFQIDTDTYEITAVRSRTAEWTRTVEAVHT